MTPMAPDADRNQDRTIEFLYDTNNQGYSAYRISRDDIVETKTRIMHLPDGYSDRFQDDIETLRSWGAGLRITPSSFPEAGVGYSVLRLHDTPMVRDLLAKMDYAGIKEKAEEVNKLLANISDTVAKSGFVLAGLVCDDNGDWTRRPLMGYDPIFPILRRNNES